jgi:hypothetical protein
MNNINILIVFFLLLTIFYLFFQTLMNKVDNKLNNLNLKVDSQPVKLEFTDEFNKYIIQSSKYNNETGEKDDNIEVDKTIVNNIDTPSESFIESFDQYQNKNKVFENKQKSSHICFINHKHSNCNLGVMNYSDPADLNGMDYKLFKLNYPPNMTLQDYVNWLYCYKDDGSELSYNHLRNLDKLKRNIPLEEIKNVCPPPGYEYSPLEADKYFDKLYNLNNEFRIASSLNSQTGPLMAYNSEDYSEFNHNFDVKGTSSTIRNCDIGLKKTSNEVRDFLSPKDSNFLGETEKNKKYFQKNIEI